MKIKKLTFNAVNLTKFLKGSAILLLFSSFVISCHDNDVIEKEEDNQDPDTEESINLALGKTVETRINSITGSGSNTEKANLMTDGDLTTYWESADSYKHSILIDLGSVQEVSKIVEEKLGFKPTLVNPRFASGVDKELLNDLKQDHDLVITLEDGILRGGFGESIASFYGDSDIKVKNYGLEKEFYDRYNPSQLLDELGITPEKIVKYIESMIK